MKTKIKNEKLYKRWRRHKHVRNKVKGTSERPRVCVYRSNDHIYAQIIDDTVGQTIVSVSSLKVDAAALAKPAEKAPEGEEKADKSGGKKGKKKGGKKGKVETRQIVVAREVGRNLADIAKEKGITKVAFDRGGYLYHGRVAALAAGMREGGLDF